VSANRAYIEAGYSENSGNATRLKGNESVRKRVDELRDEIARAEMVTAEEVIRGLRKVIAISLGELPIVTGLVDAEGTPREPYRLKCDPKAATGALKLLGETIKLFTQVHDVNPFGDLSDEQLQQKVLEILRGGNE
jgi:hypothetical protein